MNHLVRPLSHHYWQVYHSLLDLLFPPRCVDCGASGKALCDQCAQRVQPVGSVICDSCGRPQPSPVAQCRQCQQAGASSQVRIRIAALYTDPLRGAIHALKYEKAQELAKPLARYLVAVTQTAFWPTILPTIDGVVPVPLHTERRQARGYNQAEVLASAFCYDTQLPLRAAWLIRQRSTPSQVGLTAAERRVNVQDAFVATEAIYGKRILLIDDVSTTGATMRACAQAALAAGAEAVYGLALASPT